MRKEIKIKSRYSFLQHPIKWHKDRKMAKLAEILVNQEWENGLKHEVELMTVDCMIHGIALFDQKTGKRVRPDILK